MYAIGKLKRRCYDVIQECIKCRQRLLSFADTYTLAKLTSLPQELGMILLLRRKVYLNTIPRANKSGLFYLNPKNTRLLQIGTNENSPNILYTRQLNSPHFFTRKLAITAMLETVHANIWNSNSETKCEQKTKQQACGQ